MEAAYRTHLARNLPGGESPGQPAEKLEPEIKHALVERQINQLRNYAFQIQQTKLRVEATTQAGELAQAMQRVRVEIAERKRTEEALRESEAQLRAVLDATPFPVALVDVQGSHIEFWSRSALALFGHVAPTAAEWYQIAYPDPDYRREVIERWNPCLEQAQRSGQAVNTGEYRVACRDGSVRICELHAAFVADKLVVTFHDITERKRVELALCEKNAELETALARVKSLSGLLPICAGCKKIRDGQDYWHQVDSYIAMHSEATFTHGLCPECIRKLYPDLEDDVPGPTTAGASAEKIPAEKPQP
jgi:PAS domain S-box-containing protein